MAFRFLVATTKGPLHLSVDERSRFAQIHPPWSELAVPYTYDAFFSDEAELAGFISGSGELPEAEAAEIAAQLLERAARLRAMGRLTRLRSKEAAALRQFRSR